MDDLRAIAYTPRMADVIYRIPGFLSTRSTQYIESLIIAGWREDQIARFKIDLPRFESASIEHDFEDSIKAMPVKPDEAHYPFLKELHEHIKIVCASERSEELQRKAVTKDKDSMAANFLLAKVSQTEMATDIKKTAAIHFHVKDAKSEVQVTRGKPRTTQPE